MTFSTTATLASLFFFSSYAVAGIVAPNCDPSWNWASNSLGQNPCLVVAYLMSTCSGGSFTVQALQPGQNYVGPSGQDDSNKCKCSTITYNLISACDGCQGSNWTTWSLFTSNCTTTIPPSSFPNAVPDGTRVPQWALIDITNQNLWNANQSYSVGDNPEIGPGTLISPSGTTNSSSTGPTSTSSNSATPGAINKHSSNTGAIVGGVVGGIAAISAAIAALFFYRRRRQATPPGPTVIDERASGFNSYMEQAPRSMSGPGTVTSSVPDIDHPSMLRFYDPNDPTTYPNYQGPSPPPMYPRNSSTEPPLGTYPSSGKGPHIVNPASNSQGQGPGYTGLPEPES